MEVISAVGVEAVEATKVLLKKILPPRPPRVEISEAEAGKLNDRAVGISKRIGDWFCDRLSLRRKSGNRNDCIRGILDDWTIDSNTNSSRSSQQVHFSEEDFRVLPSRGFVTDQIIEELKNDEISSVGIYGLSGIGKTWLIKTISEHMKMETLLDKVVIVNVSINPDLKKIQSDIANQLDLYFGEDEPFSSRSARLFKRLDQSGKTLIVLDDQRTRLELAEVGIPYKIKGNGCKVVLTARNQFVCAEMETDVEIELPTLSENDAWTLFQCKAGEVADLPTHQTIARDIVYECRGVPLAIVAVGMALRNKKDKVVWNAALEELKQ